MEQTQLKSCTNPGCHDPVVIMPPPETCGTMSNITYERYLAASSNDMCMSCSDFYLFLGNERGRLETLCNPLE